MHRVLIVTDPRADSDGDRFCHCRAESGTVSRDGTMQRSREQQHRAENTREQTGSRALSHSFDCFTDQQRACRRVRISRKDCIAMATVESATFASSSASSSSLDLGSGTQSTLVSRYGSEVSSASSAPSSSSVAPPELIIIGAGIAGCALAYSLACQGRQILLVERDLSEPDRIVGELLQPGGVAALHKLGLQDVLQGIDAVPVEGYCVMINGRRVGIPYPETTPGAHGEKSWADSCTSGKNEGRSFHHGRLISNLRKKCIDHPNVNVLEGTVRDLVFCEHTNHVIGASVAVKAAAMAVRSFYAPITVIADGCFSKFRTTLPEKGRKDSRPRPKTRSHFVGIILDNTVTPLPNHGTVCLTPSGPVLLYQIADEAKETRMLVDVKGKLPSVADGSLKQHIIDAYLPHLPSTVHEATLSALDTQRLRTMPNSFLPPHMQGLSTPNHLSGAILLGDAWNMRHPLTGGGMTVAFNDAVLLTEYLKPSETLPAGRAGLRDWDKVSAKLREWFWERKKIAGVVNVLSMALYDLFGADDPKLEVLREGCFGYFELGGDCVQGPVGLLSALTPKPLVLVYHFFAVALYSIYILFTRGKPGSEVRPGVLDYPGLVVHSAQVFWTACVVILPVIWTELRI